MNEDPLRQQLSRRQALKLLGSASATVAAGAALPAAARAAAPAVIARVPDVELTWFMWTGSPAEVAAWEHDISFVTQQYPNIHIKFVTAAWPDYWTKLPTEAASGTLQDIISLQSLRTGLFAPSFQPLTPYIRQAHFDLSAFDSSIIGGLTYEGSVRALPYDFGPIVIYYNIDMFKAAGVPLPRIGWTWDEFLTTAKKLTSGNKYGFFANPYPDWWLPFALSDGARYLDSSGKLDLTNPSLVAAFQKQIDLVQKYKVAPVLPATKDANYSNEQWQAGNVAMSVDGPWDLINDKAVTKFTFGIVPIPKGTKASVTMTAGSGFGLSTTTKHAAEAWKSITLLTGPRAEQYLASAGRAFAARKADQQYWYKNAVPGAQAALQAALASAVPYKITPQWSNISFSLFKYGISALNGEMSAKDALQAVQTQFGG